MKAFLLLSALLAALGTAHAATSQPVTTLALSQNLGNPATTAGLTVASADTNSVRQPLPLAPTSAQGSSANPSLGVEWESGLVLALAGVLALLVVARRRVSR